MIMVGPGTGIAPFRAFLQERLATGARGRNWLFFGDQHRAHDFLYEDELIQMGENGLLTGSTSRSPATRRRRSTSRPGCASTARSCSPGWPRARHFYVCGDATRMAKDVDAALHEVVARHGGMDADDAADYVATMRREKRYVRDVY